MADTSAAEKEAAKSKYWLTQIDEALRREKDWRKKASDLVAIYEGEKDDVTYNILYSNTETLGPALYNSTPVPVVKRRFDDDDPLGGMAAKAGERTLKYLSDDGMSEDATFDELMQQATLEALVPGRGTTRFRYAPTFEKVTPPPKIPAEGDDPNAQLAPEPYERVASETVCGEEVPYDRFLHGYAKKWKDVPWVAFYFEMTREEVVDNFGPDVAGKVDFITEPSDTVDDGDKLASERGRSTVRIIGGWEIWDKATKKVYFVTPSAKDILLKTADDPLNLTGFFPCPKPLQLMPKISSLLPVPLYKLYEKQAEELNRVSRRITKIVEAVKVRGAYDGNVEELERILTADDNVLVAATNVAALQDKGGLANSIWLYPIKDLVPVLLQLYQQREAIKSIIFELTGIADIMRGSSQASETLGAQELKNQWGTLRLKRMQKKVASYARDSLRIMEEIAFSKLSAKTLQGMTGLPVPLQGQKDQLQQLVQAQAAQGQQPDPRAIEAIQGPSFDDLKKLLDDDVSRSFRVDIETNSTVDSEATQDKQDITELLGAISQFMTGVGPLIESGTMPFDVAKTMLLAVTRRFRFGPELEDQLKKMQAPQPKPDPAVMKAQMDQQKQAADMKRDQEKAQLDAASKQQDMQNQQELARMDMEMKRQEHVLKMEELRMKSVENAKAHDLKIKQMQAQVVTAHAMPKKPAAAGKAQ